MANGTIDRLTRTWCVLAATLALVLWWSPPARAEGDHDIVREEVQAGRMVPLQQILEDATRERAGTVLEIELKGDWGDEGQAGGERVIYEVEILDADGVVWKMYFDPHTGHRISETPEEE